MSEEIIQVEVPKDAKILVLELPKDGLDSIAMMNMQEYAGKIAEQLSYHPEILVAVVPAGVKLWFVNDAINQ